MLVIVTGTTLGGLGLAGAAFAGALTAMLAVYVLAHSGGRLTAGRLVLAGVALAYPFQAGHSFVLRQATPPAPPSPAVLAARQPRRRSLNQPRHPRARPRDRHGRAADPVAGAERGQRGDRCAVLPLAAAQVSDMNRRTSALTVALGGAIVLDGVDVDVPDGAFAGVLGSNGSEKSTLIGAAYRALRPHTAPHRPPADERYG
ncbi:hypothetical protein JCM9534A_18110 [Catenuloplanes indicus JCM 9534]